MLSPELVAVEVVSFRQALTMLHPGIADSVTITCEDCYYNDDCNYAFDLYNTDGDCLAIK